MQEEQAVATAPCQGYLGLGSNLGDRAQHLRAAVKQLAATPGLAIRRVGRVYGSPAWGYVSDSAFLNTVIEITWAGTPLELLAACERIEELGGRTQHDAMEKVTTLNQDYADRVIDIDILWLKDVVIQTERLTLPHSEAHRRAFVLRPWLELAPSLELNGRSLADWLGELPKDEVKGVRTTEHRLDPGIY